MNPLLFQHPGGQKRVLTDYVTKGTEAKAGAALNRRQPQDPFTVAWKSYQDPDLGGASSPCSPLQSQGHRHCAHLPSQAGPGHTNPPANELLWEQKRPLFRKASHPDTELPV